MEDTSTKKLLFSTVKISLVAQIVTGLIDALALTVDYTGDRKLVKGLLVVELTVQIIEFIFYVWLFTGFEEINNITPRRYYDWMFTTPSMLFVLIVYLDYIKNNKTVPEKKYSDETWADYLKTSFIKHGYDLSIVIPLNFLMLVFGYLGEINIIKNYQAVFYGFLPFIAYFYYIYEKYAKYTRNGRILFFIFAGLWSLYGVSALFPYLWKNISYNILDIFSKNFFGIFLAYIAIFNV